MFDDISFLVQETFRDFEKTKGSKRFLDNFFAKDVKLPEEVPGFFYHLQKKASTFVIRIHPTSNLREDYKNITKHPGLYPSLRLNEGDEAIEEKLSYFECDRIEVAQNIKSCLGNKRYPMYEERVLNVSDPSDSWWLKLDDNKITIMFKLSHTDDVSRLIKLGPLGESDKCLETFNQLYGYFKLMFPIDEYVSGHGQWSMTCAENSNVYFEYLKVLFSHGETSYDFWEYLRKLEMESESKSYCESLQKANYFMMELSFIRHFWRTIEEQL